MPFENNQYVLKVLSVSKKTNGSGRSHYCRALSTIHLNAITICFEGYARAKTMATFQATIAEYRMFPK